jgi:hypothetical protein
MMPGAESYPSSHGEAMARDAQDTLDQVKGVAQETVGTVMQQAQGQVSMRLTDGLDQASGLIGEVADAVESVGRQLRQNDQAMLAEYASRAAHQIDRFSAYLEENDVEDLVYDAERFARRQPAVFLGGAFALGFLAVRFLKSSAPRSRPGYQPRRYNAARTSRPRLSRPVSAYETASYPSTGYRYATPGSTPVTPPAYPAGDVSERYGPPGAPGYPAHQGGSTGYQGGTGQPGYQPTHESTGYQGTHGSGPAMHTPQHTPHEPTLGTERDTGHEGPHTFNPGV